MVSDVWPKSRRVLSGVVRKGLALGVGLLMACLPVKKLDPALPEGLSQAAREAIAPENGSGHRLRPDVIAPHWMVVAANPYASEAGAEILRAGGSAVDAAIAMSLVLALVEPQSSGIGGGGFLLTFNPSTQRVLAYDGRETAPAQVKPTQFLNAEGKPLGVLDAVSGGISVGTPGMLRLLELAHRAEGKLAWSRLFAPAIRLSEQGFQVSPRLHKLIASDPLLPKSATARAYFLLPDGSPLPVGHVLKNPALAQVLRRVASEGVQAFYTGVLAEAMVKAVGEGPRPGALQLSDLAGYQAKVREALCVPWRQRRVCGFPPPSSGGLAVAQLLGIFEQLPLEPVKPETGLHPVDDLPFAHFLAEASRLVFADRNLYVADPDFVSVPVEKLLSPAYLKARAALIQPNRSLGLAPAGVLASNGWPFAPDRSLELPATSHLVVVDAQGRGVSMTNTIESAFGSRVWVQGFLLNNELTDFSFVSEENGQPVANRLEPGKRPRSSMTPTLVLDEAGQLEALLGSPGGSQIIGYVARPLLSYGYYGLPFGETFRRPHLINRNGATELERVPGYEGWLERLKVGLSERGHTVLERELNSGLHGIQRDPGGWRGAVDPRREGLAVGD